MTNARPIILYGVRAPVQSSPIIRLQRPITIASDLYTLPATTAQLISQPPQRQPSMSTSGVHQFIPALRPPIPVHDFPNKIPADLETEEDEEEEQNTQAADTNSDYMHLKRM
jgi:hypothetical protein